MALRARSGQRRTDLADRRDAGAAERGARRAGIADAADPEQACALCATGSRRSGLDRLHAGNQRGGAEVGEGLSHGTVFHSGLSGRRHGAERADLLVVRAWSQRRREHRRWRRGGSRDRDALRGRAERFEHDAGHQGSVLGVPLQLAARQLRRARRASSACGLQEERRQEWRSYGRSQQHRRRVDREAEGARRGDGVQLELRRQGVVDSQRRSAAAGRDKRSAVCGRHAAAGGAGPRPCADHHDEDARHLRDRARRRAAERQAADLRGGQGVGQTGRRGGDSVAHERGADDLHAQRSAVHRLCHRRWRATRRSSR